MPVHVGRRRVKSMRCAASTRPSAGTGQRGPSMERTVASAQRSEVAWKIRNEQRLRRRQHCGDAYYFERVAVGAEHHLRGSDRTSDAQGE